MSLLQENLEKQIAEVKVSKYGNDFSVLNDINTDYLSYIKENEPWDNQPLEPLSRLVESLATLWIREEGAVPLAQENALLKCCPCDNCKRTDWPRKNRRNLPLQFSTRNLNNRQGFEKQVLLHAQISTKNKVTIMSIGSGELLGSLGVAARLMQHGISVDFILIEPRFSNLLEKDREQLINDAHLASFEFVSYALQRVFLNTTCDIKGVFSSLFSYEYFINSERDLSIEDYLNLLMQSPEDFLEKFANKLSLSEIENHVIKGDGINPGAISSLIEAAKEDFLRSENQYFRQNYQPVDIIIAYSLGLSIKEESNILNAAKRIEFCKSEFNTSPSSIMFNSVPFLINNKGLTNWLVCSSEQNFEQSYSFFNLRTNIPSSITKPRPI